MTDEPKTETADESTATIATAPESDSAAPEKDSDKPPRLDQSVAMVDIGPCKKHIKVTIERGAIDALLNEKYSELVGEANVPGFRPGKAPRRIIEKKFEKEVGDQVKAEIMMRSLEQLAEEQDVAPLSQPDLDPRQIQIPKQGPMVYEFDVEVRPQFDLPDYRGLKLRRPVRTFTDQDVVEEESRILARFGQLVPKPEGKAALGDYLVGDIVFKKGDQVLGKLTELRCRVDHQLAFKDGVAPKFAEQTLGVNAGETRIIDIALSENVADPALSGQTIKANLEVKDVKSMRLPELTHELCHQFGVHSPEQLRERIRVLLERRLEYTQRQEARQQVLEKIAAAANWLLPTDLLARQSRAALSRRVMEMRAGGMSDEDIQGRLRLLQQDSLRSTELALKEHFVLQKIAETEKIEVSDDDIEDEIERISIETDESPRRVRARLEKEDMLEALAIEMIERKVLDLILQNAEYEDYDLVKKENFIATVEEQAVPGEMKDPSAVPAPEAATAPAEEKTEK